MPSNEKVQRQRARAWTSTGSPDERRRRLHLRETFLRSANRERVILGPGAAAFDPLQILMHAAAASAVAAFASVCTTIPRLLKTKVRVDLLTIRRRSDLAPRRRRSFAQLQVPSGVDELHDVWAGFNEMNEWARLDALVGVPLERAGERETRHRVIELSSQYALEFLLSVDVAGWRYLRRCKRSVCERFFVARDSDQTYCGDRCRRAAHAEIFLKPKPTNQNAANGRRRTRTGSLLALK